MSYIDGFVTPVPAGGKEAYRAHAEAAGRIILECGATRVMDAWASDVPNGEVTDLKRAVAAQPEEVVVFGWIEWPSKAVRDAAWPKLMTDERLSALGMPFDGKRMAFGGFDVLVETVAPAAQAQAA
jgi:uncharacterized protein YbaA (DUF1428 family)